MLGASNLPVDPFWGLDDLGDVDLTVLASLDAELAGADTLLPALDAQCSDGLSSGVLSGPSGSGTSSDQLDASPSAEPAGRGGRVRRVLTAAERAEKLRAKNRASQARYRARQKELREQQEAQHETLSADLERERSANQVLQRSVNVQEALLGTRDTAQTILERAQKEDPGPKAQAAAAAESIAFSQTLTIEQKSTALLSLFHSKALPRVAGWGEPLPPGVMSDCASHYTNTIALTVTQKSELAKRMEDVSPSLIEMIKGMTPEQFIAEWSEFSSVTRKNVEELDAGIIDEEEMNRRMTPLVMYKGITHALSSMHNPENMRALFAHTSPPGLSPAEQEERWLRIAETFDDMPEEQAAVCLSNYHLFQERLKDLTARQVATVEAIHRVGSQAVLGGPPVTSVAGAASSMQGVALSALVERYLHLVDATSQYSSYSDATLRAVTDFMAATGNNVRASQKWRMTAACHPYFPDVVAIVRASLQRHGLIPSMDAGSGMADALAAAEAADDKAA